jgi:hypothetical protein
LVLGFSNNALLLSAYSATFTFLQTFTNPERKEYDLRRMLLDLCDWGLK